MPLTSGKATARDWDRELILRFTRAASTWSWHRFFLSNFRCLGQKELINIAFLCISGLRRCIHGNPGWQRQHLDLDQAFLLTRGWNPWAPKICSLWWLRTIWKKTSQIYKKERYPGRGLDAAWRMSSSFWSRPKVESKTRLQAQVLSTFSNFDSWLFHLVQINFPVFSFLHLEYKSSPFFIVLFQSKLILFHLVYFHFYIRLSCYFPSPSVMVMRWKQSVRQKHAWIAANIVFPKGHVGETFPAIHSFPKVNAIHLRLWPHHLCHSKTLFLFQS